MKELKREEIFIIEEMRRASDYATFRIEKTGGKLTFFTIEEKIKLDSEQIAVVNKIKV